MTDECKCNCGWEDPTKKEKEPITLEGLAGLVISLILEICTLDERVTKLEEAVKDLTGRTKTLENSKKQEIMNEIAKLKLKLKEFEIKMAVNGTSIDFGTGGTK